MKQFVLTLSILILGVTIFPGEAVSQGQGQNLKVGVIERPPFAMKDTEGVWSGYSLELFDEISRRKGFSYELHEETVFAEMLTSVQTNTTDIATANISITSERERVLDFTAPIYDSGLQIFIPDDAKSSSFLNLLWSSGIIQLIGVAFLILMIIAHLMWYFERDHRGQDYFRDDYKGGIWDAFWWAFIIVTIGGFENERPERAVGRVLAVFWILASIFFISTFTARITTSLTVAQLQTDISSYEDLRGKHVGAPKGTSIADFLDRQNISYTEYEDFSQVLLDVENKVLDAGVGDAPVVQFYTANDGAGKVALAGEVFANDSLAFALPENSVWHEVVNQGLIELKEDGTFDEIKQKYFGN